MNNKDDMSSLAEALTEAEETQDKFTNEDDIQVIKDQIEVQLKRIDLIGERLIKMYMSTGIPEATKEIRNLLNKIK